MIRAHTLADEFPFAERQRDDNLVRPHSTLDNATPEAFRAQHLALAAIADDGSPDYLAALSRIDLIIGSTLASNCWISAALLIALLPAKG